MSGSEDRAGLVFGALADPNRRFMVRALADEGSVTASELAERLPITRQAVAKHLGALGEAGLVAASREGREVRYRLTPDAMGDAMAWMADVGAQWDQRLVALEKRLSAKRG
ncbi:MAG: ArsR/SmtB family transcription factor [Actinomycetota bacterium]